METKIKTDSNEDKNKKNFITRKRKRFKRIVPSKRKFKKKIFSPYIYKNLKKLKYKNCNDIIDLKEYFSSEVNKINGSADNSENINENNSIIFDIKNEISIHLIINENDINNNIYFLDNPYYNSDDDENGLRELNKSNTALVINDNQYNYKKYYKYKEKGEFIIKIKFNIFLKNSCGMFLGCRNISDLNFSSFKTSDITNMSSMFRGCSNLKNLNLSFFDTKNVEYMNSMFYDCNNLINLNLSSFNTEKVINLNSIFYNCKNLVYLNLSSFNTKNVTDMSYMFYNCENLINLDLTSFDTKNVVNMSYMFANCSKLLNLNLSSFDLQNVKKMVHLFDGCVNLENIIINKNLYEQLGQEVSRFGVTIIEP